MLRKQIQKINQNNPSRFHMPGHKGKKGAVYFDDMTEISGTDYLHAPEGIIEAVQKKLAKAYGSEEAAILVNGSTVGNQSAILGACLPKKKLLVPTNSHRSVFGALSLGQIEAVFIQPKCKWGFAQEISPEKVEEALEKDKEISGMILTNPTYYGSTSKVKAIAEILHYKNKFLIVDEAHGAHLHFHKSLPMDALEAGADVVIQSTHKILGALTQSALIHFQGSLVNRDRIKLFLAMLQSSSPSYPLMISVEEAVDEALEKGERIFGEIIHKHQEFCEQQNKNSPMILYDEKKLTTPYDASKWLFHVSGISGQEAEEILARDYGVHCELSGLNYVLAMTGIGTSSKDLEQLIKGVKGINAKIKCWDQTVEKDLNSEMNPADFLSVPTIKIPFWEGLYLSKTMIDLKKSQGKISGDFVIPYPPGIPLLFPGSAIKKEIIEILQIFLSQKMTVIGLTKEGRLSVFEEGESHDKK